MRHVILTYRLPIIMLYFHHGVNANACNAMLMLHVVGVTEGCVNVLLLSACNQFRTVPQSLQLLCTHTQMELLGTHILASFQIGLES